ncbi:MAG: hypothetical protein VX938_01590 [Myxococcota bacterium]|nr:hypothetical protein [Myxococcota bacterium]
MSEQKPEGLFMRIWWCFDAIIGPVVDTLVANRGSTLRRQPDVFPVMWEGGFGAVDGTPFVQTRDRLEE